MDKFETYQADQFVGRNAWRKLKTSLDRIGGGKEENGVLIGKKGQLMEEIATPDQEQLNANLKSMKSFAQSYPDINTSVMLVPDAANVWQISSFLCSGGRSDSADCTDSEHAWRQCELD